METIRIYQQDPYRKTAEAAVSSVNYDGRSTRIILDQTIFFPTGGGQSCDTGTITFGDACWPVTEVIEEGESVIHLVSGDASALSAGDSVDLAIDWDHRFDNMQRHCGEHILSGAFFRLYGGGNKGFHMGEDYMTIDIEFPEDASAKRVTWEMARAAELDANRVIWEDVPVHVNYFDTREEAETYPLRKALAFEEDISVVTIGDPAAPADCVACCGTHPSSSGQVGLIKIFKIEPNKGMSRIYFEAGSRAFGKIQQQFDTLYDISVKLSAGTDDVLAKFDAYEHRAEETHAALSALRGRLLESEADTLAAEMQAGLVKYYDDFTVDDIFNLGKKLSGSITGAIALVCRPANTAVLLSEGEPHCGKLVKENASPFGGKGGGNATSARAFFPDAESLDAFLSKVL